MAIRSRNVLELDADDVLPRPVSTYSLGSTFLFGAWEERRALARKRFRVGIISGVFIAALWKMQRMRQLNGFAKLDLGFTPTPITGLPADLREATRRVLLKPPPQRKEEELRSVLRWLLPYRLFHSRGEKMMLRMCQVARARRYRRGQRVYSTGDEPDGVYIVLHGSLSAYARDVVTDLAAEKGLEMLGDMAGAAQAADAVPGGDFRFLALLSVGDAFGFVCLMNPRPRPTAIIANENVDVLFLEKRAYEDIAQTDARYQLKGALGFLKKVPLLSHWTDRRLERLLPLLKQRSFLPGQVLMRQGDHCGPVFIVKTGQCAIQVVLNPKTGQRKPSDSRQTALAAPEPGGGPPALAQDPSIVFVTTVEPGELIGDPLYLAYGGRRVATVVAMRGTHVYELAKLDFERMVHDESSRTTFEERARTLLQFTDAQITIHQMARTRKGRRTSVAGLGLERGGGGPAPTPAPQQAAGLPALNAPASPGGLPPLPSPSGSIASAGASAAALARAQSAPILRHPSGAGVLTFDSPRFAPLDLLIAAGYVQGDGRRTKRWFERLSQPRPLPDLSRSLPSEPGSSSPPGSPPRAGSPTGRPPRSAAAARLRHGRTAESEIMMEVSVGLVRKWK
eukprot:tig00021038_g17564.t1